MASRRCFMRAGAAVLLTGATLKWQTLAGAQGAFPVSRTDAQWRAMLSADQYDILRREGTERPFSSPLNDENRAGLFACAGCNLPVFSSEAKFDSGTGWPSFTQPIPEAAEVRYDTTVQDTLRTEVHCIRCGSHLGHVFEDGPAPTGLRYRINGLALKFSPNAG